MGTKLIYEFDYLREDILCTHVKVFTDHLEVEDFVSNPLFRAFGVWGDEANLEDLNDLFKYRCVPESRRNIRILLSDAEIPVYDPYLIVRKTHGVMCDDLYWIRFDDENELSWADVNPINFIQKIEYKGNGVYA